MNFLNKSLVIASLIILGCLPKEDPVEPFDRGGIIERSIDAGSKKNNITFYAIESDSVIATARPEDWDFYVDDDVFNLNYFRSMRVAKLNAEWHEKLDTLGLEFSFIDAGDNLPKWQLAKDSIYVIDYGIDENGDSLGLVKVEYSSQYGKIFYSPVWSAFELAIDFNEGYFNLRNEEPVDLPLRSEYDIAFGKYTDVVTIGTETQEYLIYGGLAGDCLITEVGKPFAEVDATEFNLITFNPDEIDAIGWDWKSFNLDKGAYEIVADKTYLILTLQGFRYKLRFTNFYDSNGISGHPTFEVELL